MHYFSKLSLPLLFVVAACTGSDPQTSADGAPTEAPFEEGDPLNPYTQNVLKGDYPIIGKDIFLNLTFTDRLLIEGRRVPTPDVSIVDLTAELEKDVTVEQVNDAFRAAASGAMKGILEVSDEPLVSVDYIGHPASSIVDLLSTFVVQDSMVKVMSWYDNEWGFSNRMLDTTIALMNA